MLLLGYTQQWAVYPGRMESERCATRHQSVVSRDMTSVFNHLLYTFHTQPRTEWETVLVAYDINPKLNFIYLELPFLLSYREKRRANLTQPDQQNYRF